MKKHTNRLSDLFTRFFSPRTLLWTGLCVLLWAVAPIQAAPRRVALVIGNATYPDSHNQANLFGPLANPVNDAQDIASVLHNYGFTTSLGTDMTKQQMDHAINAFIHEIHPNDVALFYYSGHGVQVEQENFLIPIGRTFQDGSDVKYGAVSANWIVDKLKQTGIQIGIVILDACRDILPLTQGKGLPSGAGLAGMSKAEGVIISYAAEPGHTAYDSSRQRNSLYTGHLLEALTQPDQPLEQIFKTARTLVVKATRNASIHQIPWTESGLIGEDFCFGACRGSFSSPTPTPQPFRPQLTPTPTPSPFPRPTPIPRYTPTRTSERTPPPLSLRHTPKIVSFMRAAQDFGLTPQMQPQQDVKNQFQVQGETIRDHTTGLMWQKAGSSTQETYQDAQQYIAQLNRQQFAGYNDWRMPTIPELMSLIEMQSSQSLYLDARFDPLWFCWSVDQQSSGSKWIVDFHNGMIEWREHYERNYVRAVRQFP